MKAVFLVSPKKIELRDIPIPKINENQVLVRIKEVGLCGSDVSFYNSGRVGDLQVLTEPIILGHESSGVIESVGKNVRNFKEGDRVSIEPGIPCYKCEYCRSDNYNLCSSLEFLTIPPRNGAFCEYIAYYPNFLYKIPDNVSYTEAALVEPLSVGYTAALKSKVKPGSVVGVIGCGPIGLSCLEMSKAAGATKIFATDISDYNLSIARKHGAYKFIDTSKENLQEIVNEEIQGNGLEAVIEAVGIEKTVNEALSIVRRGGIVSLIGCHADLINISLPSIVFKGIKINGIFRYSNSYPNVIGLLASKKINFDNIDSNLDICYYDCVV
ncbi:MAG: NAD(P)-dependent alcohol dehydrogenase [Candidatus Humimicrobiaceae bacterium]